MFKSVIGERTNNVKNMVEKGAVKKFAESIGDPHPIFIDEKVGRDSIYGKNIVPITFPRLFDYGVFANFELPGKGLIHGEQTYYYERPLFVGEEINCWMEVKNYKEKSGKSGTMGLLTIQGNGEDSNGKLVFRTEQVIIITETVKRGWKHEFNHRNASR